MALLALVGLDELWIRRGFLSLYVVPPSFATVGCAEWKTICDSAKMPAALPSIAPTNAVGSLGS